MSFQVGDRVRAFLWDQWREGVITNIKFDFIDEDHPQFITVEMPGFIRPNGKPTRDPGRFTIHNPYNGVVNGVISLESDSTDALEDGGEK